MTNKKFCVKVISAKNTLQQDQKQIFTNNGLKQHYRKYILTSVSGCFYIEMMGQFYSEINTMLLMFKAI